jgi:hypothetical protein
MNLRHSPINLPRGLFGAISGAVIGAVAPAALAMGFTACRWVIFGTAEFDRVYDLRHLRSDMIGPVIGCSVVFACAGWTTLAPRVGRYRFAWTLATLFLITLPLWFVVVSMELTPRRYKGVHHPEFYPSELMVVIGPPIVVAIILTAVRARRVSKPPP